MDAFCKKLIPDIANGNNATFVAGAWYHQEMDYLLFLTEDCSYRADRVDAFLTVLWHRYEERLVGIMVKGFRFLFQRLRARPESPTRPIILGSGL